MAEIDLRFLLGTTEFLFCLKNQIRRSPPLPFHPKLLKNVPSLLPSEGNLHQERASLSDVHSLLEEFHFGGKESSFCRVLTLERGLGHTLKTWLMAAKRGPVSRERIPLLFVSIAIGQLHRRRRRGEGGSCPLNSFSHFNMT